MFVCFIGIMSNIFWHFLKVTRSPPQKKNSNGVLLTPFKEFLQADNKKMYRSAHQDEMAKYEEAIQFLKRNSTDGTIPRWKIYEQKRKSFFLREQHNMKATPTSKTTTMNYKPLAGMLIWSLKRNTHNSTTVPIPSIVTNHHSKRWHEKASHKTSHWKSYGWLLNFSVIFKKAAFCNFLQCSYHRIIRHVFFQ